MAMEEDIMIVTLAPKKTEAKEDRFEVEEDFDTGGRFDMTFDDFGF